MGFKHWFQGLEIIFLFFIAVAIPCFFVGLWGSKMMNHLGNAPSRSVVIQASAAWKIFLVEIFSFLMLIALYIFLMNLKNA